MVERFHGMEEVARSIRVSSTSSFDRATGFMLGGLVAGEGCYSRSRRSERFVRDGSPRYKFSFSVTMADRDRAIVELLRDLLACGSIYEQPPAKAHHQPTVSLQITREADLLGAVVPFSEKFLLSQCAKRRQFDTWHESLVNYLRDRPSQYGRGPSTCRIEGCERPVRGQGLCRSHYHQLTGY